MEIEACSGSTQWKWNCEQKCAMEVKCTMEECNRNEVPTKLK